MIKPAPWNGALDGNCQQWRVRFRGCVGGQPLLRARGDDKPLSPPEWFGCLALAVAQRYPVLRDVCVCVRTYTDAQRGKSCVLTWAHTQLGACRHPAPPAHV